MYGIIFPWPIVRVVTFIDAALAAVRKATAVCAARARKKRQERRTARERPLPPATPSP
jgi:hypothetical protein